MYEGMTAQQYDPMTMDRNANEHILHVDRDDLAAMGRPNFNATRKGLEQARKAGLISGIEYQDPSETCGGNIVESVESIDFGYERRFNLCPGAYDLDVIMREVRRMSGNGEDPIMDHSESRSLYGDAYFDTATGHWVASFPNGGAFEFEVVNENGVEFIVVYRYRVTVADMVSIFGVSYRPLEETQAPLSNTAVPSQEPIPVQPTIPADTTLPSDVPFQGDSPNSNPPVPVATSGSNGVPETNGTSIPVVVCVVPLAIGVGALALMGGAAALSSARSSSKEEPTPDGRSVTTSGGSGEGGNKKVKDHLREQPQAPVGEVVKRAVIEAGIAPKSQPRTTISVRESDPNDPSDAWLKAITPPKSKGSLKPPNGSDPWPFIKSEHARGKGNGIGGTVARWLNEGFFGEYKKK
ncbi:MAG: hypothetical protein UT34_C0001G0480 [candidate division WS6 bacterium GW2011_GWF2_39_15]|uniref:Uncharacterized protein n=1 Tax=candidate division WS6 bacterium GW2011_GWF2_39_15 TaxID=1619100 RepID=A0A0G0MQY1_9BACT|nr:MAG: hypothetical protein UT34_C0001G0480 [candidate division WS6 bacterium GW2011_GWF2_39_15]